MERPAWALSSLRNVGVYYEGVVDDAESLIQHCKLESVTTFGVRTSRRTKSAAAEQLDHYGVQVGDQECHKENKVILAHMHLSIFDKKKKE